MTRNKMTTTSGSGQGPPVTTAALQPLLTPVLSADDAVKELRSELTAQMLAHRDEMLTLQRQMMAQLQALAERTPPTAAATEQPPPRFTPTIPEIYNCGEFLSTQGILLEHTHEVFDEMLEPGPAVNFSDAQRSFEVEVPVNSITTQPALKPPPSPICVGICYVTLPTKQFRPRKAMTWKKRKKRLMIPKELVLECLQAEEDDSAQELLPIRRDLDVGKEISREEDHRFEPARQLFDETPDRKAEAEFQVDEQATPVAAFPNIVHKQALNYSESVEVGFVDNLEYDEVVVELVDKEDSDENEGNVDLFRREGIGVERIVGSDGLSANALMMFDQIPVRNVKVEHSAAQKGMQGGGRLLQSEVLKQQLGYVVHSKEVDVNGDTQNKFKRRGIGVDCSASSKASSINAHKLFDKVHVCVDIGEEKKKIVERVTTKAGGSMHQLKSQVKKFTGENGKENASSLRTSLFSRRVECNRSMYIYMPSRV